MEVDTDDDLIESPLNEAGAKGPPPDITHHFPKMNTQYAPGDPLSPRPKNLNTGINSSSVIAKMHRSGEHQPLLSGDDSDEDAVSDFVHLSCNHFEDDPEFNEKIKQVEFAIDHNVLPQRIYEGSSGSYFAKNVTMVSGLVPRKMACCGLALLRRFWLLFCFRV